MTAQPIRQPFTVPAAAAVACFPSQVTLRQITNCSFAETGCTDKAADEMQFLHFKFFNVFFSKHAAFLDTR